ncbi:hypothetical protein [Streptomyces sp. NPDC046939]|uniref:hypothetical protein n=1 Tax=Streptomyces sp. NPDC046939 TaxID=3155376 RepID=UPI0033E6E633
MTEQRPTVTLNTFKLRAGDVLWNYGMRILLRGEAAVYTSTGGRLVHHWADALVTNIEDVKAEGFIPLGWLYPDKWGIGERGGWGKDWGAEPKWPIQGNELAFWHVEREESE